MDFFGAQDTTKMLLKVGFGKTTFVKFKISNNNFKIKNDETQSKQPKIHIKKKFILQPWILKISRKISENQSLETFA
jgi:hypothetical protein